MKLPRLATHRWHRWFNGTFSTYCGLHVRNVSCTRHDNKTTCQNCLRSMGRYALALTKRQEQEQS
jgi:hypothetical protein